MQLEDYYTRVDNKEQAAEITRLMTEYCTRTKRRIVTYTNYTSNWCITYFDIIDKRWATHFDKIYSGNPAFIPYKEFIKLLTNKTLHYEIY